MTFTSSNLITLPLWSHPIVSHPYNFFLNYYQSHLNTYFFTMGFPCGSGGKESACNSGDLGLIPELGRYPGEGKGYPLQYSGLENSMAYIVHEVAISQTWLSNFHFPSQWAMLYLNRIQIYKYNKVISLLKSILVIFTINWNSFIAWPWKPIMI